MQECCKYRVHGVSRSYWVRRQKGEKSSPGVVEEFPLAYEVWQKQQCLEADTRSEQEPSHVAVRDLEREVV
eukprot:749176-Hanusia_phi.AAC.5